MPTLCLYLMIYCADIAGPYTLYSLGLCNKELNKKRLYRSMFYPYIIKYIRKSIDLQPNIIREDFESCMEYLVWIADHFNNMIIKPGHLPRSIKKLRYYRSMSIFESCNCVHDCNCVETLLPITVDYQYRIPKFKLKVLRRQNRYDVLANIY